MDVVALETFERSIKIRPARSEINYDAEYFNRAVNIYLTRIF